MTSELSTESFGPEGLSRRLSHGSLFAYFENDQDYIALSFPEDSGDTF